LAFFFASLDQDGRLAEKVVVIDDPMTSLDEHRRLTTVQEMRRLYGRVRQMIVLSHSKAFLCAVWDGADRTARCALQIVRSGGGSTLAPWDVRQDTLTPHDRRHELVREYLRTSDPTREREVAARSARSWKRSCGWLIPKHSRRARCSAHSSPYASSGTVDWRNTIAGRDDRATRAARLRQHLPP
jgi:hypothetical protein